MALRIDASWVLVVEFRYAVRRNSVGPGWFTPGRPTRCEPRVTNGAGRSKSRAGARRSPLRWPYKLRMRRQGCRPPQLVAVVGHAVQPHHGSRPGASATIVRQRHCSGHGKSTLATPALSSGTHISADGDFTPPIQNRSSEGNEEAIDNPTSNGLSCSSGSAAEKPLELLEQAQPGATPG